jgi:hypothetical protein
LAVDKIALLVERDRLNDPSPLTTESLIQEFGFQQVEGAVDQDVELKIAGISLRTNPEFKDREGLRRWSIDEGRWGVGIHSCLRPRTKGQLRRLLALLADIQASLPHQADRGSQGGLP